MAAVWYLRGVHIDGDTCKRYFPIEFDASLYIIAGLIGSIHEILIGRAAVIVVIVVVVVCVSLKSHPARCLIIIIGSNLVVSILLFASNLVLANKLLAIALAKAIVDHMRRSSKAHGEQYCSSRIVGGPGKSCFPTQGALQYTRWLNGISG